jgi:two-component system chemotaxis response regulator CheV
MIEDSLRKAGYVNLRMYPNGRELWDALNLLPKEQPVTQHVGLIITDIEMPQMDGHRLTKLVKDNERYKGIPRLTKLIKDDPRLRHLPVIIFSSLISEEMRIKGCQLGADEQLTKPEIGHLVSVMDHLLVRAAQEQ